jgi:hypothetical protein
MFIFKKPGASKCVILCQECAKTRLRASINSKNFRGCFTPGPPFKRGGEEGNWERKGKEGQGGVEMGRKEKGWRVETRKEDGVRN